MSLLLRKSGLDETGVARFHKEIVEYGALPGALGWYRALPFDALRSTGSVTVPTTHIWSEGDQALAARGAELTGNYVDAPYELVVLPDTSHWIPTQAPDRVAGAALEVAAAAAAR